MIQAPASQPVVLVRESFVWIAHATHSRPPTF